MDKRTLLALFLMLLLFLVFQQFVWKPKPIADTPLQDPPPAAQMQEADSLLAEAISVADSLLNKDLAASLITLENDYVKVTFNSQGASIAQVELKKYEKEEGVPVRLVPEDSQLAGLGIYHPATQDDLHHVVFNHSIAPEARKVKFWLGDEASPAVLRSYTLDESYGIGMNIGVQNLGTINGLFIDFGSGIADSELYTKYKTQDYRFIYFANNEIKKIKMPELKKRRISTPVSSYRWAALRSKYFALILMENEPQLSSELTAALNAQTENPSMLLSSKTQDGKMSWNQDYLIYAGPSDFDILKGYGQQMENVAERGPGWLRWLANMIAEFLKFLRGYIPNYGLVIIVFSMILSTVLTTLQHPLTRKGMEANRKMQEIQPLMEEIKKRYPNNMEAQRVEMAKLQKEHGVNLLGGCIMWVPLLINMPILISLYNVLRYTLDMRNASFALWWTDLSLPDKYYVLPLLMALIMIVQSRFMKPPQPPADKMTDQQKQAQMMGKTMTWIMPVMMFFIFRGLPAGLVLYYTVYSMFSAIQQYRMQKKIKTREEAGQIVKTR